MLTVATIYFCCNSYPIIAPFNQVTGEQKHETTKEDCNSQLHTVELNGFYVYSVVFYFYLFIKLYSTRLHKWWLQVQYTIA